MKIGLYSCKNSIHLVLSLGIFLGEPEWQRLWLKEARVVLTAALLVVLTITCSSLIPS